MKTISKYLSIAMTAVLATGCGGEKTSQPRDFERNGERVTLSEICDSTKLADHIASHPEAWKATFDYLATAPLDTLAPGTYEVLPEGEAFAIVSEYEPRPADSCRFEAHRRYIDVQYVISGRELMGVARPDEMKVVEPYVDDIEFYSPDNVERAVYAEADSSRFFVFFPDDPHRPSIKAEDADSSAVKKVVVKVLY